MKKEGNNNKQSKNRQLTTSKKVKIGSYYNKQGRNRQVTTSNNVEIGR
jgi:hypothetical protein